MDFKIDPKTFKVAYIVLAFIIMVMAIALAYLRYQYIAVGLIVLDAVIILVGALTFSYLVKMEKAEKFKDL